MVRETIETIVFVVVMVIIIRFFIGEIRWIPSASMRPTLIEGDRIIFEAPTKSIYSDGEADLTNPVALYEKDIQGIWNKFVYYGLEIGKTSYIKRVIGTPGDKFEIKTDKDGKSRVYINDEPLNEPYIMSEYYGKPCTKDMICGPIIIPEHQYLMMGDNRGNSYDSRWWGLLPEDRFIGRAVFLFWPLNRLKTF